MAFSAELVIIEVFATILLVLSSVGVYITFTMPDWVKNRFKTLRE